MFKWYNLLKAKGANMLACDYCGKNENDCEHLFPSTLSGSSAICGDCAETCWAAAKHKLTREEVMLRKIFNDPIENVSQAIG